jgi:60 kDa SS-A/Ro ribonucleoprotein
MKPAVHRVFPPTFERWFVMKTNVKRTEATPGVTTHGGAPAAKESAQKELVRTVSGCLLFEDSFYESGSSIAQRIGDLVKEVPMKFVADLAVRARKDLKLRHVPLWLSIHMLEKKGDAKDRNLVGETIAEVIQRADELAEILALWWKDGKRKVPRQLKAGIAKAFRKFKEYHLAKWNRDKAVKLRDALFISHAKPKDEAQKELWKRLVDGKLAPPETWEVLCSGGMPKGEAFTKLLKAEKLGYMALLQNLRNMEESGVDRELVEKALVEGAKDSWALPFRFITAAKHVPKFEEALGKAVVEAASGLPKLSGHTLLVLDVSGSMGGALSTRKRKHEDGDENRTSRLDAAIGLAMLMREQAQEITIYATAGNDTTRVHATDLVPSRHGFALSDAVHQKEQQLGGGGIFLKQCMEFIDGKERRSKFDRVVCITDEQDCDIAQTASQAMKLGRHNYIVNVGVYEPALPVTGAGWVRVSGFSERVVDWMMAEERDAMSLQ